ncbi:hypothetical protein [Carboxylicivirga sp. RSCT41]|uniref:hypothetical protein n=1 Tax=Carboxylicivirga agarovorans TaxID=3417570 RepID=UPI003D34B097
MKVFYLLTLIIGLSLLSCLSSTQKGVSIEGNQFYFNSEPTYKGVSWNGHQIEGLLFNSRMVQGIFDDLNPATLESFIYPDTKQWDAQRNTREFVAAMEDWKKHGLLSFTLNLQGGSPLGYGNKGWINSAFNPDGSLDEAYTQRLALIMDEAKRLDMVVILGLFYFGQDEYLMDEQAVIQAVDEIACWISNNNYRNVLIEVANECDIFYDHEILKPERIVELIARVQKHGLLCSASFSGGVIPHSRVVKQSDYILLHGNAVEKPEGITYMVNKVKNMPEYSGQPIVFNEDDHFGFDQDNYNLKAAVESYASWGYFDYRHQGESFENGFQSVPVNWTISSERKRAFFNKIKEITNY